MCHGDGGDPGFLARLMIRMGDQTRAEVKQKEGQQGDLDTRRLGELQAAAAVPIRRADGGSTTR
jgi:hypothetical protein